VGALVGPQWTVGDELAYGFARTFLYQASGRQRAAFAAVLAALRERLADVRAGRAGTAREKRKVLEVREREDGLEILLHGQRFRLIRVADEEEPR